MQGEGEKIIRVNIEEEMKSSYIDYSMSVIVSRALPDVRDGMKPVHRRVMYGMYHDLNLTSGSQYKKSVKVVGEVMGKYHPHGDASVYDTMVRMAQWWNMRYPLVDGQGNFGSPDGDSAAAMRYTEARMRKIAEEAMADLEKETVDFRLNFDESESEPTVLPAKLPMMLLNGASGIAVGMATNMPPHNLGEVAEGICAYIDNRDISVDELMHYIKAPDFPTGGIICGTRGIREAYETGRGKVIIRAKTDIEVSDSGREVIVITELPYQVNKAELIKQIWDLAEEKKVEGISFINDESDRNQKVRIVVKVKKDAVANVVLNHLFKHTPLQSSFSINNIVLVEGRPRLLALKDLIHYYVKHRHEVVLRRTRYELRKAEERLHILQGYLIALDNIEEVIKIIRASDSPDKAIAGLMQRFSLSEIQSRAIVDMRLRALTGLEKGKIQAEFDELTKLVNELNLILASETIQFQIIKDELQELKKKYDDGRLSTIQPSVEDFNPEDFYADEDVVITISHLGYIKRTVLTEYRTQSRGGVGAKGSTTREEDFIEHIYIASMHDTMLFFTEQGRCFWLKVYEIPEGVKASKGRALQNVIHLEPNDKVRAYINVKNLRDEEYINSNYIVLCTKDGIIKKTKLEAYSRPRLNGVNAITIREGDQLLEAILTNGNCDILIAAKGGKAIRFAENKVRAIGRTASGVKAIDIEASDEVIGMVCVDSPIAEVLVVSENGFGKRSPIADYRITNRGGKGVKTINITEKTGDLIAVKDVNDQNDLMIINKSGTTIRMAVADIRIAGRATQGVKLINIRTNDSIAAVAKVPASEDVLPEETSEDTNLIPTNTTVVDTE